MNLKRNDDDGKKQSGQSTVELIVALFGFFTVFFMFVQVCLSFAVANYFQYATFMASRAFLSGYANLAAQKAAAADYLNRMVKNGGQDRFSSIATGTGGDSDITGAFIGATTRVQPAGSADARATDWEQGVTYTFKVKLYLAPLISGVGTGASSTVTLESQSWMGREPNQDDCEATLQLRQKASGVTQQNFVYDNGC